MAQNTVARRLIETPRRLCFANFAFAFSLPLGLIQVALQCLGLVCPKGHFHQYESTCSLLQRSSLGAPTSGSETGGDQAQGLFSGGPVSLEHPSLRGPPGIFIAYIRAPGENLSVPSFFWLNFISLAVILSAACVIFFSFEIFICRV